MSLTAIVCELNPAVFEQPPEKEPEDWILKRALPNYHTCRYYAVIARLLGHILFLNSLTGRKLWRLFAHS
jgi:hypothetical protein